MGLTSGGCGPTLTDCSGGMKLSPGQSSKRPWVALVKTGCPGPRSLAKAGKGLPSSRHPRYLLEAKPVQRLDPLGCRAPQRLAEQGVHRSTQQPQRTRDSFGLLVMKTTRSSETCLAVLLCDKKPTC